MKDVVENEAIRELNCKEKINTNVFTKNNGKDIIYNKYNLLNKNNDFYEREGLSMRKTEDIVLNKVLNGLSLKERILVKIFSKTFSKVYRKGMIECFNYYNK